MKQPAAFTEETNIINRIAYSNERIRFDPIAEISGEQMLANLASTAPRMFDATVAAKEDENKTLNEHLRSLLSKE